MRDEGPREVTDRFVRELLALGASSLDEATLAKASLCFLDYLSCCFAGHRFKWALQAIRTAARWPTSAGAPIIGTRFRVAPSEAAYVNSVMAVSASRTDMHPAITSHIGPVVFPAALACASIHPVSGLAFLTACVAGYEAEARVGRVLVSDRFMRHHRATSVLGTVGGAIVAARLLDLPHEAAVYALSISANTSSGLMEWAHTGDMDLLYEPANAARASVAAALLAGEGATSSRSILEGPGGLLAAHGEQANATRLLVPSGDRLEIHCVDFKAVPACVFVQAAAFAALDWVARHGAPGVEEVEHVTLRTFASAIAYPGCNDPGPVGGVQQARMSLQFTVASVLARGELGDCNFAEFEDPRSAALISKVRVVEGPEFTAAYPAQQGAEVEVALKGGNKRTGRVDAVPPVLPDTVLQRFLKSAEAMMERAQARAIAGSVLTLASAPSVDPLLELLAAPSEADA